MQNKLVRCDQCNAEAWVSVTHSSYGQLDFCSHHYSKHSLMLHAQGWSITNDERETLHTPIVAVSE